MCRTARGRQPPVGYEVAVGHLEAVKSLISRALTTVADTLASEFAMHLGAL